MCWDLKVCSQGLHTKQGLLPWLEAALRVYNLHGRRDNKYKARIKILVHETGLEELKADIEAEFAEIRDGVLTLPASEIERITTYFTPPAFEVADGDEAVLETAIAADPQTQRWWTLTDAETPIEEMSAASSRTESTEQSECDCF